MYTTEEKHQIRFALNAYCNRFDSQNIASKTLKSVSAATVSQVLNHNWDNIKESMWRHIAAQVDHKKSDWVAVETRDYKKIHKFCKDAKKHSLVLAIIGDAGSGKTKGLSDFIANNRNSYILKCGDYWNRRYFLSELLTALGRESSGLTVADMMEEAIITLKKKKDPLLILDEADKLADQVMYFFITLYNELEDHCGIILCATDHLKTRVDRGLRLNKRGYKEIYSRVGRKFIELHGLSSTDIYQICMANGIKNRKDIKEVINDSEGDLRRVKRKIHALKGQMKNELEAVS